MCRKRSHTDAGINLTMACMNTYALMKCNFVCSKFAHISKDGNSSSKSVLKNIQRSFHGHRICIVAVIYDHELVSLDHIESSTDRFQTFDTVFDLLCIQSVKSSDGSKAYLEAGGTKYDLVLCGKQASDSDTSLVMPELAECLGLPQVTFVSGYELSEGKLIVQRETDEGTDHIELPLPAVASVDKTVFEARRPNMRLKLKANHMEIPVLDAQALGLEAEEIGVKGSRTTVGSSYFPEHNKSCVTVSGESSEEIAGNLLSALRSARMI